MTWSIEPHTNADKRFAITGDEDLYLEVDNDDVDHDATNAAARRLCDILNEHWSGP